MRDLNRYSLVAALLVVVVLAKTQAQQVIGVTPQAAAPGDVVILTGTNLGGTTAVRFGAEVGGFAGFWVVQVPPVQATATMVSAIVPTFGNFLPPGPFGSSPVGTIDAGGSGFANSLPFFYMEQTAGQLATAGLGTTQGGLAGRPVIGFWITGGPPVSGNSLFTLTLENATPLATAALVLGFPAGPPLTPYLDGLVGIDLLQPVVTVQPFFAVNPAGDVIMNVPIPAVPFNATFTVQWVIADPVTGAVGISNGMSVAL